MGLRDSQASVHRKEPLQPRASSPSSRNASGTTKPTRTASKSSRKLSGLSSLRGSPKLRSSTATSTTTPAARAQIPRTPNIQDPQSKYPGPQFQGPPRKLTAPSDPPTGHFHPCRLLGRVRHPLGHFQIWNLRPPMDQDPSAKHQAIRSRCPITCGLCGNDKTVELEDMQFED